LYFFRAGSPSAPKKSRFSGSKQKIMARSSRLQAIEWLGFAGPGPRDSPELGISTRLHRPPCCQGSRWLGKAVFRSSRLGCAFNEAPDSSTARGAETATFPVSHLCSDPWPSLVSSASAVPRFPGTSQQHLRCPWCHRLSFRCASSVFGSRPQTSFAMPTPVPGLRRRDETWQD